MNDGERLVIISADGHAGADVFGYRPYLESKYLDEFDTWSTSYQDPWGVLDSGSDEDNRLGAASFASIVNWDSDKRTEFAEAEGIAAEVLFPNTAPLFFPSGLVSAHPPANVEDLERRFAGLRAHNRWLVDFCAESPGRRGGIAQVFLHDVDKAIDEVRWAKEHGLVGVLLPPDSMLSLSNIYYPRLDRFWAVCEEIDLPVHRHAVTPSEAPSPEAGAGPLVGLAELAFLVTRPLVHLILAGVFDRYPTLKMVVTEAGAARSTANILPAVAALDPLVKYVSEPDSLSGIMSGDSARALKRAPSEYVRTNVYFGSFFVAGDIEHRDEVGVDHMMWGGDLPHHEGTFPNSVEALRINFGGLPDEEIMAMTSGTAVDVYGFDMSVLQPVADRIGPTLGEVKTPLSSLDDVDVQARYCPTFRSVAAVL